jgi:hypothetical protein
LKVQDVSARVFGPFRMEPVRHLLVRDGKPVSLTAEGFNTLTILLRRRGFDASGGSGDDRNEDTFIQTDN